MTSALITNFKNMLLYIGAAATKCEDCPMTSIILSKLITWIFDNTDRASKIQSKFRENRIRIHEKYASGKGESLSTPVSKSYADALQRRDRSLFKHIDLFPGDIADQYPSQINWFSEFLVSRMESKHMVYVWAYLDKIDQQVGSLEVNKPE